MNSKNILILNSNQFSHSHTLAHISRVGVRNQRRMLNRWQIQHASTSSHIVSDWRLTAVRADGARHLQKLFFQLQQIARGDLNCQTKKEEKKNNISEKMKVLYSFRHKTRLDTRTRITWSRKALIKKNKQTNTRRLITVLDLWDCEWLHRFFFFPFHNQNTDKHCVTWQISLIH